MKINAIAYGVLASVFVLSFVAFLSVPDGKTALEAIFAAPAVAALFGALFQLVRDQAEHEKRLDVQRREFQFTLGAASHMANIAFDHHAEFCGQYMKELHETVATLFREGETASALTHAGKLHSLRIEFATWLTNQINTDLEEFEGVLRQLGASAHFVNVTTGVARYAEQRSLRIDQNHEIFARILGIPQSDGLSEVSMVEALKGKVKAIVGTEELAKLREHLVRQASSAIGV